METMVNFWKNKKVLITGHTGFKGSWLTLLLHYLGAEVIGVSLDPPSEINLFTLANIAPCLAFDYRENICNFAKLQEIFRNTQPEIVFHLAAQSLVRYSYDFPLETYSTNIMGTVNVLEAAKNCETVKAIVNVTTDKCYDNKEWHWGYREIDPVGGVDPYSSSKACSELVTNAYRDSYFKSRNIGVASARAGNVVGGGDWAKDRLIPDIINSCISNTPLQIRYPNSIRPWQHVLEPLCGYLNLACELYKDPQNFSEAWNFGPVINDDKQVHWIVKEVVKIWDESLEMNVVSLSEQAHESTFLKLDCSKALSRLDWQPKWGIDQTLKATVDWYKAFHEDQNMKSFTQKQILDYLDS